MATPSADRPSPLNDGRAAQLLRSSQWADGWAAAEAERADARRAPREWARPRWEGEPLTGVTVLVHADGTLSDTLLGVRWLAALRRTGARVVLVVPPSLVVLLAANQVADAVYAFSDAVPPHDVQVPLSGLPHRLQLHEDRAVKSTPGGYLRAPGVMDGHLAAWSASLPPHLLRVGVAWVAGPRPEDRAATVPLGALTPLFERDEVAWVSLQTGQASLELAQLPRHLGVLDPSALLGTFARAAQLMAMLDAVLTCDGVIAHLAGALGKRTWLLLPPGAPDWPWASDEPGGRWYDSVELLRVGAPDRWDRVIAEVGARVVALESAPRR